MDNNLYNYWGAGSKRDLSISYEEYNEIVNLIHDERLSREAMMQWKNLFEINSNGMLYVPIFFLPPAILLANLALGRARRSHSGYRYFFTALTLTYPLTCWFGYTLPIPRRLHTQIMTDPSDDGTYIRQRIKQSSPGLWRKISSRLNRLGYDFPEMNERLKNTEFPLDFVN